MANMIRVVLVLGWILCTHTFWQFIAEEQQNLLQTTQTHIVPAGEYFQFTIAETAFSSDDSTFQKLTGNITLSIEETSSSEIKYNILIFPNTDEQITSYNKYQCYARAAQQGFENKGCGIAINHQQCEQCVQNSVSADTVIACTKCPSKISFIIEPDENRLMASDHILMVIIDNTNVITQTGSYLEMSMIYNISMQINTSTISVIIIFMILVLLSILVIIISSICIKIKSRRLLLKIQSFDKMK